MANGPATPELISKSVSGDRVALQKLLLSHYAKLSEYVDHRIPRRIQNVVGADDIVQQTFVQVVRDVQCCTSRTEAAFFAWLKTIAENRVKDAIRYAESEKRGGGRRRVQAQVLPDESSLVDIVELLSAGSHTPSQSVARHEAIAAVHETIEALRPDYRQAVQLRLLQGISLEETASIMERSPRAVQGLIDRAREKMRAALGRLSLYE